MCSSQSEPELSSPPELGSRKRIRDSNYLVEEQIEADEGNTEETREETKEQKEDTSDYISSVNDDNFEVKKKKRGRPRKNKEVDDSNKSKTIVVSSTPSDLNIETSAKHSLECDDVINLVDYNSDHTVDDVASTGQNNDLNSNLDLRSPVTINAPDQINRNYEMELGAIAPSLPSSSAQKMWNVPSSSKMIKTMASAVAKSLKYHRQEAPSALGATEAHLVQEQYYHPSILPKALVQSFPARQSLPLANSLPSSVQVRGSSSGMPRQSPCGARHVRLGGPRMLRPPRPGKVGTEVHRPGGQRRPLSPLGPRVSNPSPKTISSPQLSSQTPAIVRPVSPSQSVQFPPPSHSAFTKLTSLGVSIVRERSITHTKQSWLPPSSLTVIKTPSEGPRLSISSLATVLHQLGQIEGRRRLVQFRLTEEQVGALDILGLQQE
eukprot:GFUD01107281.1.p1 GENE.GFUD01107281.1~~GFUD01107281.1.p1  ORF type:complete len:435 (-),score=117.15 GFUD01107281.1:123-1427(-)